MTATVPPGTVAEAGVLSRHLSCPSWCVIGTGVAAVAGHRGRLGVEIHCEGSHHRHVYDLSGTVSFRGLLAQRCAPVGAADRDLVVVARSGHDGYEVDGGEDVLAALAEAVRRPDDPIGELNLVSGDLRERMLGRWNRTARDIPGDSVAALIAMQARRAPHSVALVDDSSTITYADLDARANRLARLLTTAGVSAGSTVGVCFDRSARVAVAILAVWRAGGAFVPLDPDSPPDRLRLVSDDAGLALVLTERAVAERLPVGGPILMVLDGDIAPIVDAVSSDPPDIAPGPADLAYVIYTSGSTGTPKGVQIEHRSLVNLLSALNDLLGLTAGDSVLAITSLIFDIALFELFSPLLVGARVNVASTEKCRDGVLLGREIRAVGPTHVQATPSAWHMLLDAGQDLPPITALCGGEPLSASLAHRLLASVGSLWNVYGPTETTIWSTAARIGPAEAAAPPVGTPLANTTAYIVDEHLRPVPIGAVGELCLGGAGLARGYLHCDELTARQFIDNPFEPGGRLYRTGDLARYAPDGVITVLGRRDGQVKIAGHRIELGEVDAAFGALPGITRAVTVLRRREHEPDDLVAFVTVGDPPPQDVRLALRRLLPAHAVPTLVQVIDVFPALPSGKVDRAALARLAADPVQSADGEPPADRLETAMAALWKDLLGVAAVGRDDDFFALGGTSLHAGRLVNRLERHSVGDDTLYVRAVFDAPTLSSFCRYVATEYPMVAAALSGEAVAAGERRDARRIDSPLIRQFRRIVTGPVPRPMARTRLGRAAFLLSAPRSGSTLLRVMLAGHPGLFVPPELELLGFDSMADRDRAFSGSAGFAADGLLRAVRELFPGEDVRALVRGHETVADMFSALQGRLKGRLLVDKTSTYALDSSALSRAEQMFEEPVYVHLVRHPGAMIHSYQKVRLDQVFRHRSEYLPRELAELIWLTANDNLERFLSGVPDHRKVLIRYEDLIADPDATLRRVTGVMGVDFDPAMLDPYADQDLRMVDGLHSESRMAGDTLFARHGRIRNDRVDAWRGHLEPGTLSSLTDALARRYGYTAADPAPVPARSAPLSSHQRSIYLHDLISGDRALYTISKAWRLRGPLDELALRTALQYVFDRHEALRTKITDEDGVPRQHVRPAAAVRLEILDLPPDAVAAALEEFAANPLDLGTGDVFSVLLLRLTDGDHVFALAAHHALVDGASMATLLGDLEKAYDAALRGGWPDQPPARQPFDFHTEPDPVTQRRELAFWRDILAGAPPLLPLPTTHPRPARKRFRGDRVLVRLDGPDWQAAQAFARSAGVTSFMLLLATFTALLRRYTHTEQIEGICVGTAFDSRPGGADEQDVVGMFTRNLPLYTRLADDPSFDQLLSRVRDTCLEAFGHHRIPLDVLVRELGLDRDPSYTPLVQVLFGTRPSEGRRLRLDDVQDSWVAVPLRAAKFDLSVGFVVEPDSLTGTLAYDTDLFNADAIDRMAGHYVALLRAVVHDPSLPLSGYRLLGDDEERALRAAGAGPSPQPDGPSIAAAVHEHARLRSDAVALADDGHAITYAELDRQTDELAAELIRAGAAAEHIVAVLTEHTPAYGVACLGVLKSGAAYLPLDPGIPPTRIAEILKDAGVRTAVVARSLADLMPDHLARITISDTGTLVDHPRGDHAYSAPAPEKTSLAYVIYTSGSTGQPKGVQVDHAGLASIVGWYATEFRLGPDDVCIQVANLAFDASAVELWPPLLAGATLRFVPRPLLTDPAALWRWLGAAGATAIHLMTSLFEAMLDEPVPPGLALRDVLVGGDRLRPHPALGDLPFRLFNVYGPTENTVISTAAAVAAAETPDRAPSIGRPLPGTSAHVLDEQRRPVPIDVPGELYVGGRQLARGYLNRPDLTTDRFVTVAGERLYRTGDLARRRPDGMLDFIGRRDNQVKIRGYRVEIGEVEATLKRIPGVRDAAVVVTGTSEHRVLAGFYVGDGDPRPALVELLPAYLIPSVLSRLDALPLTPNGKIDRRALAARPVTTSREQVAVEAATEMEAVLLEIWRETLGNTAFGVTDSFFQHGGDSLSAMRLISLVRRRTGHDLDLQTLFSSPTVRAVTAGLGNEAGRRDHLIQLSPGEDGEPLVCVHAADGTILPYAAVSAAYGPGRPVWGLQALGGAAVESVEAAASVYAAEVARELPDGPLTLLGWSFGGLIAFEMAHRLASRRGGPLRLLLLDSFPVGLKDDRTGPADPLIEFARHLRRRAGATVDPGAPADWNDLVRMTREGGWLHAGTDDRELRTAFEVFRGNAAAAWRYQPKPIDLPLNIYVATSHTAATRETQVAAWDALTTAGMTVTELPGDHFDVMTADLLRLVVANHQPTTDQGPERN
jgi:amino acid adenylation domain-containing protein